MPKAQFDFAGTPVVVALNMTDVAERRGRPVDELALSKALGVPVVPIVARSGQNIEALVAARPRFGEEEASAETMSTGRPASRPYRCRFRSVHLEEALQSRLACSRVSGRKCFQLLV